MGGRLEQEWNHVNAKTESSNTKYSPKQTNFIPYFSINFTPTDEQNISLSYTNRILRPSIWNMNPYRDESTPLFLYYGNPNLKTAVWNTLALKYGYFGQKWSTSIEATAFFSNNYVSQYSFVDASGITNTTYGNIVRNRSYGVTSSIGYRDGTKLNITLNLRGRYQEYNARKYGMYADGFTYSASLNANVGTWKGGTIFAQGSVRNNSVSLINSSTKISTHHSLGVRQKFVKDKLTISLSASNPFTRTTTYKASTKMPTMTSFLRSTYQARTINASVNFRFGKSNVSVKSTNRSIENDDMEGGKN